VNSVDIQIRLLGGQFKMRLEVNALGLFCFGVRFYLELTYFVVQRSFSHFSFERISR